MYVNIATCMVSGRPDFISPLQSLFKRQATDNCCLPFFFFFPFFLVYYPKTLTYKISSQVLAMKTILSGNILTGNQQIISKKFVTCFFCLATLFLFLSPAIAANKTPPPGDPKVPILSEEQAKDLPKESTQGETIPIIGEEYAKDLDEIQEKSGELLISAANWVDSFFDNPQYAEEENRTRAKLKLKFGYSKLYDFEFKPSVDLKIKLPKFSGRANIYLSANDDSDFDTDSNPMPDTPGNGSNNDEELSVGIQYFLKMGEHYNITTHFGLSLGYVYGGLRYRHTHKFFSDELDARFTDRLRYYSDDGWDNRLSYDVESNIGSRYFMRTSLNATIAERYDGIPFSTTLQIYKVLSIDKILLWENGAYFDTKPDFDLTDIQLKLRYRQRFYRDWLVLEVAPQLTFPADHDHDMNPGLIVRFEADFGYLNDRKAYQSIFSF